VWWRVPVNPASRRAAAVAERPLPGGHRESSDERVVIPLWERPPLAARSGAPEAAGVAFATWRSASIRSGVVAGDRVALLAESRPEWSLSDYAILANARQRADLPDPVGRPGRVHSSETAGPRFCSSPAHAEPRRIGSGLALENLAAPEERPTARTSWTGRCRRACRDRPPWTTCEAIGRQLDAQARLGTL
jgi:hypothetical protein